MALNSLRVKWTFRLANTELFISRNNLGDYGLVTGIEDAFFWSSKREMLLFMQIMVSKNNVAPILYHDRNYQAFRVTM